MPNDCILLVPSDLPAEKLRPLHKQYKYILFLDGPSDELTRQVAKKKAKREKLKIRYYR